MGVGGGTLRTARHSTRARPHKCLPSSPGACQKTMSRMLSSKCTGTVVTRSGALPECFCPSTGGSKITRSRPEFIPPRACAAPPPIHNSTPNFSSQVLMRFKVFEKNGACAVAARREGLSRSCLNDMTDQICTASACTVCHRNQFSLL